MKRLLPLVVAACAAACASQPPHSWRAALEARGPGSVVEDGDVVARSGPIAVRVDDVLLDRNRLAGVTVELRNDAAEDAAVLLQRASPASVELRGSISRAPAGGGLSSTAATWEPWSGRDAVHVPAGGRVVLGLAQNSVFAHFPPAPEDEVVLRVVARVGAADHAAEVRFRVASLEQLEEPNPFLR